MLIPVRIDVPQLDDAHDPVCWFLPNARTIRLLRTAGVSFTTGIDQGAVTNAAAIGVVPNPAFRECTLVMRGVSSGSMRVRVTCDRYHATDAPVNEQHPALGAQANTDPGICLSAGQRTVVQ